MVTGGQTPGTAQLAVMASRRDTPLSLSKIRSSPVPVSTAGMRSGRSGHSGETSRVSTDARRFAWSGVSAASAIRPIFRPYASGVREVSMDHA